MSADTPSIGSVLREPSAFIPVVMSLLALAVVLTHIALYGVTREADEGTAAHLWQLLMAGQLPSSSFLRSVGCLALPARASRSSPFRPQPSSPRSPLSISCTSKAPGSEVPSTLVT